MFADYLRESHVYSITPLLGFVVFVCLALISVLRGRKNPTNLLFAGICFFGAIINIDVALVSIIPDKTLALKIDRLVYLFFVFFIPVYIKFVHSFLGISRRKWLEYLACSMSLIFLFFTQTGLFITGFNEYSFGAIAKAGPVYHIFSLMAISTVIYCILTLFLNMKKAGSNQRKNRIKYTLFGMGLSSILISLNYLPVSGFNVYPMGNFSFIPAIVLAFGVLKYDLLDIGAVIRKGTIYFSLSGILTILYILVIYIFNSLFMHSKYGNPVVLSLVFALMIALLFNPIKTKVQDFIDNLFFRGKYDYQKTLKEISGKMTSLLRFDEITSLLTGSISEALQVSNVGFLIYDSKKECFQSYSHRSEQLNDTGKNRPLAAFLERNKKPLSKTVIDKSPVSEKERKSIINAFDSIGASLVIPMILREKLTGMITLGEKKSGELFVREDMELLSTIANQSAIAIENARNYEKIEKRKGRSIIPRKQKVSILFSDIRGFSEMSEEMSTQELCDILNSYYFSPLDDIIFEYNGPLDKHIGDSIMGVFGAPISYGDDAERAVMSAIEMREKMAEINGNLSQAGRKISIGIGISAGEVMAGIFGSHRKKEYTVFGSPVNLASRLEHLAEEDQILICDETYHKVRDVVEVEKMNPFNIKGMEREINVFNVIGEL